MTDIVRGATYCSEFNKGQFQDLFCSIFSYAICFTLLATLILQIMRMTLHNIARVKAPNLLSIIQNNRQQLSLSLSLSQWLYNNCMKLNTGKSHLLLSGNSRATATINNSYIESEDKQLLLGITIDSNLTFENNISSICKKASQK